MGTSTGTTGWGERPLVALWTTPVSRPSSATNAATAAATESPSVTSQAHEVAVPARPGDLLGHPPALLGPAGRHPHRPTGRAAGDGDAPSHAAAGPGHQHDRSGPGDAQRSTRTTVALTPGPSVASNMVTAPSSSTHEAGVAPARRTDVDTTLTRTPRARCPWTSDLAITSTASARAEVEGPAGAGLGLGPVGHRHHLAPLTAPLAGHGQCGEPQGEAGLEPRCPAVEVDVEHRARCRRLRPHRHHRGRYGGAGSAPGPATPPPGPPGTTGDRGPWPAPRAGRRRGRRPEAGPAGYRPPRASPSPLERSGHAPGIPHDRHG